MPSFLYLFSSSLLEMNVSLYLFLDTYKWIINKYAIEGLQHSFPKWVGKLKSL